VALDAVGARDPEFVDSARVAAHHFADRLDSLDPASPDSTAPPFAAEGVVAASVSLAPFLCAATAEHSAVWN